MTPQELKKSLLLLAFQGKMTSQRKEESSFQLLHNINKSSFGNKKYLLFSDDLASYDIPDNWSWCMFHQIVSLENGKKVNNIRMPYLEAKYLRGNSEAKSLQSGECVEPGTKVILVDGENSGEVFIIPEKGYMGSTFKVLNINNLVDEKYVLLFMKLHQDDYRNNKKGAAIPHLNKNVFFEMPFPLAPLEEQKRIVTKIEELLPMVDRYEEAWVKLKKFNKRFPVDMEKSILQYAIKGKLVDQRQDEGNAYELLPIIRKEKKELISKNIIKKENQYPEVPEEEQLFDIPDNWCWCRLGDIGGWQSGSTPLKSESKYYENGTIPWLVTGDLNNGYLNDVPGRITEKALNETSVKLNPAGSVLIAMYGATIGKVSIINFPCTTNQACCACVHVESVDKKYLFYYLLAQKDYFIGRGEGGAQPNISREKIVATPFPLPPFKEQKRIAAKLDELLPLCRKLVR